MITVSNSGPVERGLPVELRVTVGDLTADQVGTGHVGGMTPEGLFPGAIVRWLPLRCPRSKVPICSSRAGVRSSGCTSASEVALLRDLQLPFSARISPGRPAGRGHQPHGRPRADLPPDHGSPIAGLPLTKPSPTGSELRSLPLGVGCESTPTNPGSGPPSRPPSNQLRPENQRTPHGRANRRRVRGMHKRIASRRLPGRMTTATSQRTPHGERVASPSSSRRG